MRKIPALVFILLAGFTAQRAAADVYCGVEVARANAASGEGLSLRELVGGRVQEQGFKYKICKQGGDLIAITEDSKGRFAWIVKNSPVPVEAVLGRAIPFAKRAAYAARILERAKLVVQTALISRLLYDPGAGEDIAGIYTLLADEQVRIETLDPALDVRCKDPSRPMAYVLPRSDSFHIYLCAPAYLSESPQYIVHELAHLIHVRRFEPESGLAAECRADLVSMIATHAARAYDPEISMFWPTEGAYYYRGCGPAIRKRFNAFAAEAGIENPYRGSRP